MSGIIEVIGLGAGDIDQLPLGIYKSLMNTNHPIMARTIDHPVVTSLAAEGIKFTSYDEIYQYEEHCTDVYEQIAADLLKLAQTQSIIYTVPRHQMLAEQALHLLL